MRTVLAGLVVLFFLSPLAALISQIQLPLMNEVLGHPRFLTALQVTIVSGLTGSFISVLLGIVHARYFAFGDWRTKRIQRLFLLFPFLVPNFVLAAAYVLTWNPGTGILNSLLPFPGQLYGTWGMTVLFAVTHAPIAFLMFEEKFRRFDSALLESARLSGASTWRIIRDIELPLLLPSIASAFALCFALNVATFAIPAWIGAPERAYTLTYKIYQSVQLGGSDSFPTAATYAVVLLVAILPSIVLVQWASRNQTRHSLVTGKASRPILVQRSISAKASYQIFFAVSQLVTWGAPLLCLFISTLVAPGCLQRVGLACLSEAKLTTYKYVLFGLTETGFAMRGSLIYGSLAAMTTSIFCLGLVILLAKSRWNRRIAEGAIIFASATPGAVIAIGLIVVYSGKYEINLYNTAWIVVIAMIIKHANLAFQPVQTAISGIGSSLSEAGRLAGGSAFQVWTKIMLPLIRPDILGAFFLVFVPILGELTMSVFLVSPRFKNIGTLIFDLQDYADQSAAAALSVILVIGIFSINELCRRVSQGRLGY